jgi:hypothetical protein
MKALLASLLLISGGVPVLAQTAPSVSEPVPINLSPAPAGASPALTGSPTSPSNAAQPGLGQLTAGLTLTLRYPGPGVDFRPGLPWQEVLLVEQNITDPTGRVVIAAGTQVLGRFETEGRGSRFVAQALVQPTQNLRISGQSGLLENRLGPNALVSMKLLSDWRPMVNSGF